MLLEKCDHLYDGVYCLLNKSQFMYNLQYKMDPIILDIQYEREKDKPPREAARQGIRVDPDLLKHQSGPFPLDVRFRLRPYKKKTAKPIHK